MKVTVALLLIIVAAIGCQKVLGPAGPAGKSSLTVVESISPGTEPCAAGGQLILSGVDQDGDGTLELSEVTSQGIVCNGTDGKSGSSAILGAPVQVPAGDSYCSAGGELIAAGTDSNGDGKLELSEVTSTFKVCNGVPGQSSAPSPLTPILAITPCGPKSSPYKEVLLGLEDGAILSSFSATMSGSETRLALLPDGSYEDTDQSGCMFSVSTPSAGKRKVSWSAGSNQFSSWTSGSDSYSSGSWTNP